jgi:hypothetical protein
LKVYLIRHKILYCNINLFLFFFVAPAARLLENSSYRLVYESFKFVIGYRWKVDFFSFCCQRLPSSADCQLFQNILIVSFDVG